jgi:hypothetical protein
MTKPELSEIKKALPKGWLDKCHARYEFHAGKRVSKSTMRNSIDKMNTNSQMYIFWLEWATNTLKEISKIENNLLNLAKCQNQKTNS